VTAWRRPRTGRRFDLAGDKVSLNQVGEITRDGGGVTYEARDRGAVSTRRWAPGAGNVLPVEVDLCRVQAMRQTHALVQVAVGMMEDPHGRYWGYELSKRSGVRSGALYPILHRMLDEGWVEDGWEDPAEIDDRRPPRRYYELTEEGRRRLGALLEAARHEKRFSALVGRLA